MTQVTSYTELIASIDAARIEMGLRHLDFEELIGVTQGHWGKATGMLQVKRLGIEKIFDALRGAGLLIFVKVDQDQRAKMLARSSERFNPMQANQARPRHSATKASAAILSRILKPFARDGGKARWANKSAKERSEHARMMAMAGVLKRRKEQKRRARQRKATHKARK